MSIFQEYINEALRRNANPKLICDICGEEDWFMFERYVDGELILACEDCADFIPPSYNPEKLIDLD